MKGNIKGKLSTILTIGASVGVVVTGVLCVRATIKARQDILDAESNKAELKKAVRNAEEVLKEVDGGENTSEAEERVEAEVKDICDDGNEELSAFEVVKASWRRFVPAFVSGGVTIGMIIFAHGIDRRAVMAASGAAVAASKMYTDYCDANIKVNGIDAHRKVIDELNLEEADNGGITSETFGWLYDLNAGASDEDLRIFYDSVTKQYFKSTLSKVIEAEYHINRDLNLCGGGLASVERWCELLGIHCPDDIKHLGWCVIDNFNWLDFSNLSPLTSIDELIKEYGGIEEIPEKDILKTAIVIEPCVMATDDWEEYY
jgi:hypothetical protein